MNADNAFTLQHVRTKQRTNKPRLITLPDIVLAISKIPRCQIRWADNYQTFPLERLYGVEWNTNPTREITIGPIKGATFPGNSTQDKTP